MRMTEDQKKAVLRQSPRAVPAAVSVLPAAWMKHREALEAIVRRYPHLFPGDGGAGRDYDAVWSPTYVEGRHVDAWECEWSNVKTGMDGLVTGHPLPRREDVRAFEPPEALLGGFPHGFMYLRLADLRGFENLMIDFAEEPPELQILIDKVLAFNLREAENVRRGLRENESKDDLVVFGDDLGHQTSLPMSPAMWRKYLKPCFTRIFAPFRTDGRLVYLHSDGCIHPIIPDLVECGVDVLNPQIGANGLDNLVRTCRGRVCVDLDLDRQMFPFASPGEIDAHVREAVEALGSPEGGLWLKAEIGDDVPLENIEAVCVALDRHRMRFSGERGGEMRP